MAAAQNKDDSYHTRACEFLPRISEAADPIDRERKLPEDLANDLKDQGFFRMLVPRSLGGAEMDYIEYLGIIETFATADGSTGWCLNQGNVFASRSAVMPEPLAREIFSDKRSVIANGPSTGANAVPVDKGYRLTGRWLFSSGSPHANWIGAIAPIKGTGKPLMCLVPKEDVNFIDIWQVNGLRGTGSFGFEINDLFVPAHRTFNQDGSAREDGPLYIFPTSLFFASGFACVALGVARAGLDAAIELACTKKATGDKDLLRNKAVTQQQVGKAEAVWGSARAFLLESASAAWENAKNTRTLSLEERIRLRLSSTNAIRMAADVVDIAYNVCGSHAIFASNPIQRRFQDVHAITQQTQGRMAHYETAGQFFLGLEPKGI